MLQPADIGTVLQERMRVSKYTVHRNDTNSVGDISYFVEADCDSSRYNYTYLLHGGEPLLKS